MVITLEEYLDRTVWAPRMSCISNVVRSRQTDLITITLQWSPSYMCSNMATAFITFIFYSKQKQTQARHSMRLSFPHEHQSFFHLSYCEINGLLDSYPHAFCRDYLKKNNNKKYTFLLIFLQFWRMGQKTQISKFVKTIFHTLYHSMQGYSTGCDVEDASQVHLYCSCSIYAVDLCSPRYEIGCHAWSGACKTPAKTDWWRQKLLHLPAAGTKHFIYLLKGSAQ